MSTMADAVLAPVVAIERICVEYDGQHVLEQVTLDIPAGQVVALLGPNGSGKSTLVKVILGLERSCHGRVRLFGEELTRFRDWQRIALVPQRLPGSTSVPVSVWETVLSAFSHQRSRFRPLPRADRAAALAALETVGLADRRADRIDSLSGGQQRRAMIARALATAPDLLVLDEPTAGLDAANVAALGETLRRIRAEGRTIVLVTHELDELHDLIDRVIVLGVGGDESVRYDGPPPVPHDLHDHVHHHDEEPDEAPGLGLEA